MKREAIKDLKSWLKDKYKKPLILRGARQVGKSTLVHLFCQEEKLDLIEINLEIERLTSIEKDNFVLQDLLDELQFKKNKIISSNSLIFFDEIQESPILLKFMRYFYEQRPDLNIIAAGSLLEIALQSENFSFPVGRIQFYHLGPMSFKEFLWATGQDFLQQKLSQFEFSHELHTAALRSLRDYYYVGGMPEAVKVFSETKSLIQMRSIQNQILQTYQADFPKYNKRINVRRIERVFSAMANIIGEKIIYSKLDYESSSRDIKRIVELLLDSRVILPCYHSDGNQVPIEGEIDLKIYKPYFIDIGLLNSTLRMDLDTLDLEFKNDFATKGIIAEQFVAQHLNFIAGPNLSPKLYYHLRDKGTQKAEIDFLFENNNSIYPIEVKSTSQGHLKSLKYFCNQKKSKIGIKVSLAKFMIEDNFTKNSKLVSLPIYAIEYLKDNFDKL